jgi:hypothetical protein
MLGMAVDNQTFRQASARLDGERISTFNTGPNDRIRSARTPRGRAFASKKAIASTRRPLRTTELHGAENMVLRAGFDRTCVVRALLRGCPWSSVISVLKPCFLAKRKRSGTVVPQATAGAEPQTASREVR